MKEIGTASEIADIYSIYTGYSLRKIIIAVTAAATPLALRTAINAIGKEFDYNERLF